ncbi:MAG TPA: heterodisulfide reductase-related iron-sulfur binding cluster [Solirubrobacterales bacterium]|nr:heterodisulfide reductase-related iron-sulfur binding cluster [Solirubrobacterales bacterium]
MKHAIAVEELGPRGEAMAAPISSCVHCGFCLPTCPTYVELGEEMDSPRGRIFLIKEELEGNLELETVLPYVDNCLGCLACVSACPSGVEYGDLITSFRARAEERRERPRLERLRRAAVLRTVSDPRAFRRAMRAARLGRAVRRALPGSLRSMVDLAPADLPAARPLPAVHPAIGERRHRVALLAGCAQQVLAPEINWAALEVLARNGVETVIPAGQGCCGALAMHSGADELAQDQARRNLAAFPEDVDAVITTAAGCGSGMAEYGLLFAGEAEEERARALAARTMDVTTFLARVGLTDPMPEPAAQVTIAYQDACHLAHAQGERSAPRALLGSIPGVRLVEPAEGELCCGSAGIYNIERPEISADLGRRKAGNLLATGAGYVAGGNIGCINQLRVSLDALGSDLPVLHTMQILDLAYKSALEGDTGR